MSKLKSINIKLTCTGDCRGCESYYDCTLPQKHNPVFLDIMQNIRERLSKVKHKIISIGGKGGVGKTLIAANLATALTMMGKKVGVLDQVFDGPCIPRMLGVEGKGMNFLDKGLEPAVNDMGIKVVSMGLILASDEVVTWFHNMKRNATEELLYQVNYGELDYLIIDVPAGTSSDTVNVLQLIPDIDGGTVATVPSQVSQAVAFKAITLLKKANLRVFGVFENMGTFLCPFCGKKENIIQEGGGENLAERTGVPFLGSIPTDERVAECADEGVPVVKKYPDSDPARIFMSAAKRIDRIISGGVE